MANEPSAGRRRVKATERKTKTHWARFVGQIDRRYPDAEKITLVTDNLNTNKAASRYETFPPREAKRIGDRFEFVHTPKPAIG